MSTDQQCAVNDENQVVEHSPESIEYLQRMQRYMRILQFKQQTIADELEPKKEPVPPQNNAPVQDLQIRNLPPLKLKIDITLEITVRNNGMMPEEELLRIINEGPSEDELPYFKMDNCNPNKDDNQELDVVPEDVQPSAQSSSFYPTNYLQFNQTLARITAELDNAIREVIRKAETVNEIAEANTVSLRARPEEMQLVPINRSAHLNGNPNAQVPALPCNVSNEAAGQARQEPSVAEGMFLRLTGYYGDVRLDTEERMRRDRVDPAASRDKTDKRVKKERDEMCLNFFSLS
ncbi:unnamed protein product [Caenorhabditis bovis]|uniref:Uncharacterized protein n=1 Tax=Caenorhabditis bovis TaxID=2654633 RepID=A0A8S1ECT7_9PELO|nr:unnamed protein product [Caenorhabditis bovis]